MTFPISSPPGPEATGVSPTEVVTERRQRLRRAIHHLEHVLPGQAPLRDFVHHNTLHGYQHLPFPEALVAVRRVTGISGYLPLERFRGFYAEGRITREDLDAVISGEGEWEAEAPLGPVTRRAVIEVALLHDLAPIPPSRLQWERESGGMLAHLRPGVEPSVREAFRHRAAARGLDEAAAVADLWQASLELLGLSSDSGHVESLLELDDRQASALLQLLPPSEDPATPLRSVAALRQEADRIHRELMAQVGVSLTLRGLLRALSDQDILEELRPYLVRQLAGFLDQGMAPWPLPGRERGFWRAWREAALADPGYWLRNLPDWEETLEHLSDDSEAVVEEMLSLLGLEEERWEGYLGRLALELPGWSGMFMWRHLRPGYMGLTPSRVEMMDYLAVRLVLERLAALRLCRRLWNLEPRLDLLGWHFRRFRAELVMRWHLFNSELPEYLAFQGQMLLGRTEENPARDDEWQELAHRFLTWRLAHGREGEVGYSVGRHAWPLFLLAQYLGLTGSDLRQGGVSLAAEFLGLVNRVDSERSGHLWLQAYERHFREKILTALAANRGRGRWGERRELPQAQLVFCMDDREEGFRRHLEERNPRLETLGAAGFFGVPMNWRGLDDASSFPLCPVVVTPVNEVREVPRSEVETLARSHRRRRSWRLKLGDAILRSSHRGVFLPALIALAGAPVALLLLAGKLLRPLGTGNFLARLRDLWDLTPPTSLDFAAPPSDVPATVGNPRQGFTELEQVARVEGLLRTMGLTSGFAPLVIIFGHGSSSLNNPHLAAYDCGACSGRHGGPNARLFAAIANRPEVRRILCERGIVIPDGTWFVGAEHDTGNETILWFDRDHLPPAREVDLRALIPDLEATCALSAQERSRRLASAPRHPSPAAALAHVGGRGVDFSQARPELGHVTNAVAFIGRRAATQGVFFDRRMFLISYDPTQDPEGGIVEGILLAAGPVGAGINLEYYFSSVDNDRFGCGTKVVHNVTGFLGVMEGTSSDLRTGLPRQMIEIHEAMRLLLIVEQTPGILSAICERQEIIRELVVNAWIQLVAMEPEGGGLHWFRPGSGWEPWQGSLPPPPMVERSPDWTRGESGPLPPVLVRQPSERAPGAPPPVGASAGVQVGTPTQSLSGGRG
ncbi:MAG: DUF2309 domain-containing protein [Magnetococcales bacterium]|nr:DUF2309 domain-containing protein [Magnetococcales bacterium]